MIFSDLLLSYRFVPRPWSVFAIALVLTSPAVNAEDSFGILWEREFDVPNALQEGRHGRRMATRRFQRRSLHHAPHET